METAYINKKTKETYRLDEKGLPYRVHCNVEMNRGPIGENGQTEPAIIPHGGQLHNFRLYSLRGAN